MSTASSAARRLAFTTFLLALGVSAGCSDPMTGLDATVPDATVLDASDASTPPIDAQVEDDADIDGGVDPDSCVATTCEAESASCETIDDGCGGTLDCGTCHAPQTCGGDGTPNVCGCTPAICTTGVDCGEMDDGCGGTVDCGGCTGTDSCAGAGTPNECGCTPTTCEDEGATCGEIPDGCGGTLTCGSCAAPQTCGGGGTANACGEGPCTPTTCAAEGLDCGTIADGCESSVDCGTCSGTDTCGGGGPANVCGCAPMSTATACVGAGLECGMVADGCGGTVECGGCTAPETCSATNLCVCVPSDPIVACGARECGTVANGCGGTHACGTCGGDETCNASGACECVPSVTCGSRVCGTIDDGCGTALDCGTCTGVGEICSAAGACECTPLDPTVACGGRVCGVVANGCGSTYECGTCIGIGETCDASGACTCVPESDTAACAAASAECGTAVNNCGATTGSCGACGATETCTANECVIVPLTIGYCALQIPLSASLAPGATVDVYGRVYVAGLTDQSSANDLDPRVVAAVGYGSPDSDPSAGGWTWIDAAPNAGYDGGTTNNDEYRAALGAPPGSYDYAYRFSGDGGSTWVYCDSTGPGDGYDPLDAGSLTVAAAAAPTITSLDLMVLAHGAMITITGTNLDTATDVSIDGTMQAIAAATPTTLMFSVDDATSAGLVRSLSVTSPGGTASTNVTVIHLVISEVDSDTFGPIDTAELVEITTGVAAAIDLSGYHVVLVDGAADLTYGSFPLATTDADGRFMLGHSGLSPAPEVAIGSDTVQNGDDAIVIIQAATAFPTGTAVTDLDVLIDALVYGATPDTGLLDALLGTGPERVQPHEGFDSAGPGFVSIQRCLDARLDGRAFVLGGPTPRLANACP